MPTPSLCPCFTQSRRLIFLCFAAMLACLFAVEAKAAPASLGFKVGFDNPRVEAKDPGARYLEVLVTSPQSEDRAALRPYLPLNIALVIDCSGSMQSEQKLETVKAAALKILDRLEARDRFCLITYNNQARVLIPSGAVEDLAQARSIIRGLESGGNTNLGEGLQMGYAQLRRYADASSLNRVFLLSDGLANVGVTAPATLNDMAAKETKGHISLSTFGVGLEFNERLMADLSEYGHGMYYFIDEPARIEQALSQEFVAARQVVARDIQLSIQLDPALVVEEVFANTYHKDGNHFSIQVGDLSAGELRRLQLRINMPTLEPGRHVLGKVELRYQDAASNQVRNETAPLMLEYGAYGASLTASRDQGIIERSQVFEARYARDRASQIEEGGNRDSARSLVEKSIQQLERSAASSKKLQEELSASRQYLDALQESAEQKVRAQQQKEVRFKRYKLEGC